MQTETLLVRQAHEGDLEALRRFEQGVINAERPFDETLKREAITYYDLAYMLASPHIQLLVAEKDGKLIGSGYARIETAKPYLQHRQHAYLGFMYVEPAYRGQGVNKSIMNALESWALEKGVTELRLEVYNDNSTAISAYEKAGFLKHMIEMRKGLLQK